MKQPHQAAGAHPVANLVETHETATDKASNAERKYHIWTIGCQMNDADSRHLGHQLEKLGYEWSDSPDGSDVVVLNTCVVRQQVEDKVYGKLGSLMPLKEANPNAVIGLITIGR